VCVEQMGCIDQECFLLGLEVGEFFWDLSVSLSGVVSSGGGAVILPIFWYSFLRGLPGWPIKLNKWYNDLRCTWIYPRQKGVDLVVDRQKVRFFIEGVLLAIFAERIPGL
jgi:hypothetical protein